MNKFKTDTDPEKRFNESRNRFQYLETVIVYTFVMMFEEDSHFFTSRLLNNTMQHGLWSGIDSAFVP